MVGIVVVVGMVVVVAVAVVVVAAEVAAPYHTLDLSGTCHTRYECRRSAGPLARGPPPRPRRRPPPPLARQPALPRNGRRSLYNGLASVGLGSGSDSEPV